MTMKLESLVNWSVFGYGMIARSQADVPESVNDPVVVFTHKMAVGGKFHNGEPILSPKEEKAMLRDCGMLVDMLNANFTHINDYVPVGDEYNRPKNVRKNAKATEPATAPVVAETPKVPNGRKRKAPATAPVVETPAPVAAKGKRMTKAEKEAEAKKAIRYANLAKGRAALAAKREQIRAEKEAAAKRAEEEAARKAIRPRTRVKATTAPVKVEEPPKKTGRRKARETA